MLSAVPSVPDPWQYETNPSCTDPPGRSIYRSGKGAGILRPPVPRRSRRLVPCGTENGPPPPDAGAVARQIPLGFRRRLPAAHRVPGARVLQSASTCSDGFAFDSGHGMGGMRLVKRSQRSPDQCQTSRSEAIFVPAPNCTLPRRPVCRTLLAAQRLHLIPQSFLAASLRHFALE